MKTKEVTECRVMDDGLPLEMTRGREEIVRGLEKLKAAALKKKYSASKKPTYDELKAYFAKLDAQIKQAKGGK